MIHQKILGIEKKIINRICKLPSAWLFLLFSLFIFLFFHTMYYTMGDNPDSFTKIDGTLKSFKCSSKFTGSDTIYLKTSLSTIESRFYGYKKCYSLGALNVLNGKEINYNVTFYVKQNISEIPNDHIGIYAIDYNGSEFLYPNGGLQESDIFNLYSLLMLYCALGIAKVLYTRWKSNKGSLV